MIFELLSIIAASYSPISSTSKNFITSYRTDYRSIIIFKRLPNNYSKIHYMPNFSKEQLPIKNHRPFGAFFPYGGLIQFDDPISEDNMISVKVPLECRNIYISTLPDSFFRIGSPPSNVTFDKNMKICLFNLGNPSEINVKMSTESFSKLSFLSIDNSPPSKIYNGNLSLTEKFNESAIIFFQTSYFYLNNFVNITTKQISNLMNIEPHSIFVSKSSLNRSLCLLLEDQIEESHGDESTDLIENMIKPTFNHKINKQYNSYTYEDYKPSYDLGSNNDDSSDDNSILTKMIVISVFMVCAAILLGCFGLACIGCYTCTNKISKDIETKKSNRDDNNGLLVNQDANFDDAIPPTIPHLQQQYVQQPTYNNYNPQTYYYIQNNGNRQANYSNQPVLIQHHPYQYTD